MKNSIFNLIFALSFLLTNCSSNTEPCTDTYKEPIILIASVSSAGTGNNIDRIEISNVKIGSINVDPITLTKEISENIIIKDSILICTIPCGFGVQEGLYEYTFSAESHMDLTLESLIEYGEKDSNCPSRNMFGQPIGFSMYPNP